MSTVRAGIGKMVHSTQVYPVQTHQRSSFNRSHSLITAFNGGKLIPIWWRYGYPGDTLKLDLSALIRLTNQIVPFMTNLVADVHFWKVPIRLIWPNWKKLQGEQENPGDSTDYLVPIVNSGENGFGFGSIFDYFGYIPGVANYDATSMVLRAYNLTYNENYRDENLQNRVAQETGDTDDVDNYTLLPRGKRKDYFTGMLPWPQKGEDVLLPLGQYAPITDLDITGDLTNAIGLRLVDLGNPSNPAWYSDTASKGLNISTSGIPHKGQNETQSSGNGLGVGNLYADLRNATAATMSQLYMANAVQQILQLDARSGTRYIELILGRWGVRSTDARLQRPEFLGGSTFDLNTSIVPQTSATLSGSTPQGNLSAFSTITGSMKTIVTSFEEHCVVFGVVSVRPGEYYYQQGLHRDFSKRSRFEFYEPGLANLPEQAVLKQEIFVQPKTVMGSDGSTPDNETILGYQERCCEDKTAYSRITGYMRSQAPTSLDVWHLGTEYDNSVALNAEFIEEDLDSLARVLTVEPSDSTPAFLGNFSFKEFWIKEMPLYSNPSLMKF